jgi:L-alanine-DL-glutamate epimerase-like enolase superfamily enzyme
MPPPNNPLDTTITLTRLDVHVFRAEVAKPVVASFGTIPSRGAVLLRLEDSEGIHGWGEIWSNFPTLTTEYRGELAAMLLPNLVIGKTVDDPLTFAADLEAALAVLAIQAGEPGPVAAVIAGFDQALWDLIARRAGRPLRQLLDPTAADQVPVYASGLNPGDGVEMAAAARAAGHRAFKQKIGFGDTIDLRNLQAISDDLGPGEVLFADANQGWGLDEAMAKVARLAPFGLGWLEEPIAADRPAAEWHILKTTAEMPIAGGENLRGQPAFTEALDWLDIIQPDVGKWGGIGGCFAVASDARDGGRTYCPHWLGSGVGLMHSAQLLATCGGAGRLEMDVNENPLRDAMLDGRLSVADGNAALPKAPGIGLDIDIAALAEWQRTHRTFDRTKL